MTENMDEKRIGTEEGKQRKRKMDKIDKMTHDIDKIGELSAILEQQKSALQNIENQIQSLSSHTAAITNEIQNNLMSLSVESGLLQIAIAKKLDIYQNLNLPEIEKEINIRQESITAKEVTINILEAVQDEETKQIDELYKTSGEYHQKIGELEDLIALKNVELRLERHLANTDRGLDTVILPEENLSKILKLINIYQHPRKYKNAGIEKPKGILFYGDPNLGKSRTAKAFAKEIGYEMYQVTPNNILNGDSKDPTETLSELFENIIGQSKQLNKPYIIFLEQLEEIIDNMGEASKFDSTTISNTIKNYIQEIQDSNAKIIIMASIDNTKKVDNEFGDTFLDYNLFDNQIGFVGFQKPEIMQLLRKIEQKYDIATIDHEIIANYLVSANMNTPGLIKTIFKDCMQDKVMNRKISITTEYVINKIEIYKNQIKELKGTPGLGK